MKLESWLMMFNKYGVVLENADLTNYNTYGIKCSAKYLIKPNSQDNLLELIEYLNNEKIDYFIIGGGSNIILSDGNFDGVVISLSEMCSVRITDKLVYVEAGINLSKFIMECVNNSLGGLENLALIPGTLGGALYGNAGVKDKCIYDYLEEITILRDNKIMTFKKEDIRYSYRNTIFKTTNDIIISAVFKLEFKEKEEMLETIKENRIKRLNSQPLELKNAGSVFKNPEGDYAGRLIESLGLKGYTIGGAQVSEKHANFIVNVGNATGKDIRDLIKYIQEKVYESYNISLELEQILIDWK